MRRHRETINSDCRISPHNAQHQLDTGMQHSCNHKPCAALIANPSRRVNIGMNGQVIMALELCSVLIDTRFVIFVTGGEEIL